MNAWLQDLRISHWGGPGTGKMERILRTGIQTLFVVGCFLAVFGVTTAANRVTLTGKVVDSNGKPLGHATVLVYHAGVKTGYSTYCPSCYVDCGKRALTDAAGAFTIKDLSPDLLFELLVVSDGHFSTFVKSVDPSKGPAPAAVLNTRQPVNDPQRVVRGRVVDAHGLPLRDAVAQPQGIMIDGEKHGHISRYGTVDGLDLIAVTNEKGEFEISYDRPALKVLLLVEARGLAPKLFNQLPTGLERQTLTMTDGATVRGCLVENGKPLAGAQIGLIPRERGLGAELKLFGSPYAEIRIGTQPDGTFLIPNVPAPVEWYIYGTMESIATRGGTVPVGCATKTDNEDENVGDIHITPGHRLRGKVVLSDGKSIADGMRVFISADSTQDSQTAMLRPDGSFEFAGLVPGKYRVSASVRGYRAPQWDYRTQQDPPGTVQIDRDIADFVLALDPVK
jgi:hypothetical protein